MTFDQLYFGTPRTSVTPSTKYQTIDLAAIWEAEILPLLTPAMLDLHALVIRTFVFEAGYHVDGKPQQIDYHEATHGCARVHTRHDGFCMEIEEAIEEAAKAGNKLALRHQWLSAHLFDEDDEPTKDFEKYDAEMYEIAKEFYPKRTCPEYWSPMASCHWLNLWSYELAKAWKPDGQWKIKRTPGHTTVIDTKNKLVFDPLLYREGLEAVNHQLQHRRKG